MKKFKIKRIHENWKDVPNFKQYQVSDLGNVKSKKRGEKSREKRLKKQDHSKGYLFVTLYKDGIANQQTVHSLVAQAFLGHKPNGHDLLVDHINGNKKDNRKSNLQVITHRENITKGFKAKKTSSKYTGVAKHPHGGWIARITINGKAKHLGYFMIEKDASKAYQTALKEHRIIKESFKMIPDNNLQIAA